MNDLFLHEQIYRGRTVMQALAQARIGICGAGALGSLLADQLIRQGFRLLSVIDDDRVELHNIGTQLYRQEDAGALKVDALRSHLFRAAGVEILTASRRFTEGSAPRFLRDLDWVVDTFDNSASRTLVTEVCRERNLPCLHLGMNGGYGEARWNEVYRVPSDQANGNACEYPLARNLILLTVAVGAETLLRAVVKGHHENYSITLGDFAIIREEM